MNITGGAAVVVLFAPQGAVLGRQALLPLLWVAAPLLRLTALLPAHEVHGERCSQGTLQFWDASAACMGGSVLLTVGNLKAYGSLMK